MAVNGEIIAEYETLVDELNNVSKEYTRSVLEYKECQSSLWLNTDFAEVLDKSRPTVDEKKAYITSKSLGHKTEKDMLYDKIQYIRNKIELCKAKLEYLTNE